MPMMRTKRKASFANVVCCFVVTNRSQLVSVTAWGKRIRGWIQTLCHQVWRKGWKLKSWRPNRLSLKPYHHAFAQRLGADSFTFTFVPTRSSSVPRVASTSFSAKSPKTSTKSPIETPRFTSTHSTAPIANADDESTLSGYIDGGRRNQ